MATGLVLTKRWGRPEGVGVLTFTGWQLTVGGVVLLPFMLAGEGLPKTITVENISGFLYLSVIGALLAYAVWFRGIEKLPALAVSFRKSRTSCDETPADSGVSRGKPSAYRIN